MRCGVHSDRVWLEELEEQEGEVEKSMESSTGFSLFSFGHHFVHSQLKSKKTGIFVRDVSPFFKGLLQLTV